MENQTLEINTLNRTVGQFEIRIGIQQLRNSQSDFYSVPKDVTGFTVPLDVLDSKITFSQLDNTYYFTSFDNWKKIIEVMNPIAQNFKWESERFDCDNRSNLMSSMISLLFRINTCASVYCNVYDANTGAFKYLHYANIISDDLGNLYLWDVDQGGMYQKITSNNVIMGQNKYNFINVRAY